MIVTQALMVTKPIRNPFPLQKPSNRQQTPSVSPASPSKRPIAVDDYRPRATIQGRTKAKEEIRKAKPLMPAVRKMGNLDRWSSATDSPDRLQLPGPSDIPKRLPPAQPSPIPQLDRYNSTPRLLRHSSSQFSLGNCVSLDLSESSSVSELKVEDGKRKAAYSKDGKGKEIRRMRNSKLDARSASASEVKGHCTPKPRRKPIQEILSPDVDEEIAAPGLIRKGDGHAFFEAMSRMDKKERDSIWGALIDERDTV